MDWLKVVDYKDWLNWYNGLYWLDWSTLTKQKKDKDNVMDSLEQKCVSINKSGGSVEGTTQSTKTVRPLAVWILKEKLKKKANKGRLDWFDWIVQIEFI